MALENKRLEVNPLGGKLTNPIFIVRDQSRQLREHNIHGNESDDSEGKEEAEIPIKGRSALFSLRQEERIHKRLRHVPDLLQGVCERRDGAWRQKIVMVKKVPS